jgi:hypothetical protein
LVKLYRKARDAGLFFLPGYLSTFSKSDYIPYTEYFSMGGSGMFSFGSAADKANVEMLKKNRLSLEKEPFVKQKWLHNQLKSLTFPA